MRQRRGIVKRPDEPADQANAFAIAAESLYNPVRSGRPALSWLASGTDQDRCREIRE